MGTEAGEEVWPLAVEVTIGLAVADESWVLLWVFVIMAAEAKFNSGGRYILVWGFMWSFTRLIFRKNDCRCERGSMAIPKARRIGPSYIVLRFERLSS